MIRSPDNYGCAGTVHRVRAVDVAHRQLRIVQTHRVGPDHDGVDHRPQAVQMRQPFRAVNIMRVAGQGGDAPVQRLPELPDRHALAGVLPQRAEQALPRFRQRLSSANSVGDFRPGLAHVGGYILRGP
jgi:hypothetical protein